jgi:hypothetical protein
LGRKARQGSNPCFGTSIALRLARLAHLPGGADWSGAPALYSYAGSGIYGESTAGVGVSGASSGGRGAVFTGPRAQVKLTPDTSASHPHRGQAGDLFVDKSHRLWFCKGGTTWKQIA